MRYRAFISYSQKDKAVGRRIQRWLETYRVPAGVVADLDRRRRLGRFFRDDDEMPASSDLAATLRGAIEDAENLIVICSPNAAKSVWVNAEILHFRRGGRGERIFAVVADGIPNSGDPATECFPPALRASAADEEGMSVEPLAIDVRKESKARICTRLAAGLLDLSFDDLWRRERRRRRIFAMQVAAAGVIAVCGVGLLVSRMLDAQRSERAQVRGARLATVSETLGSNGAMALGIVRDLLVSDPADAAVNDVARTIVSWARTKAESEAAFPMPRLFSSGTRLYLHARDTNVAIGDASPVRRIGFSRGRLVVIYGDRIVSVDEASGRILDVLDKGDLARIEWDGLAFEGGDGTGVVAGRHGGISNSQHWHSLLAVSNGGKLSILTPLDHPAQDDPYRTRDVGQVFVSPACDTLGILDGNQEDVDPIARTKFLVTIGDGLRFAGTTEAMPGGVLTLLPAADDDGSRSWRIGLDQTVEERGCRNPSFDSAGSFTLIGFAGLVLSTDVTASPAALSEWQRTKASEQGGRSEPWDERPREREGLNPCAGGCRVVNRENETFDGESGWILGWVRSSLPAGGAIAGPLTGEFAARPLFTFYEPHNAGLESFWCRRLGNDRPMCVRSWSQIEYQDDWSDVDRRSSSGRFVFFSTGGPPFEVFDVQAMRVATPAGNTLVSTPGAATFSDSPDDRLFVFADNRLSVFETDAKTARFIDVSTSLGWQRRLSGTDDANPVVGLIAHPSGDLIAVSQNGLLIRFHWQTGRIAWSRQLLGLGRIRAIRRSPRADSVALVGERGIRVVRATDGLLTSGLLIPPYVFDTSFDLAPCSEESTRTSEITEAMTDVMLTDRGEVTISCGAARFSWAPRAYSGDVRNRIETLLAPPAASR